MLRWTTRLTAIVCTMCVAIAYSQASTRGARAASSQAADASVPGRADTTDAAPIACNKVLSQADVAGLLTSPITVRPFPGGVAWCEFGNDASADITVTIGSNESIEMLWDDAAETSNRTKFSPLSGVGDQALFREVTGVQNVELASKKGAVFCIVTFDAGGAGGSTKPGREALEKGLGALCNKAYAALRA